MLLVTLSLVWVISARETKIYDEFLIRNLKFELLAIFNQSVIQFITIISLLFILGRNNIPKLFVFSYFASLFLFVLFERLMFRKILERIRKRGRNLRSILFVGSDETSLSLFESIKENPQLGYKVKGFLNDFKIESLNGQYIGKVKELEKILSIEKIDNVLINAKQFTTDELENLIKISEKYTTRVRLIHGSKNYTNANSALSIFDRFDIVSVHQDHLYSSHWRFVKRTFDIIFSSLVIICVFPFTWPFIAIAIKLDSKGPILYKQERWGRSNKKFQTLKFRTMKNQFGSDQYVKASLNDPRITRVGRFLRKNNLDELPQFINVLKGDMSVVGPRPHPTKLNLQAKNKVRNYMLRHLVKPGITGWAQINGFRGEIKDEYLLQKRTEYDLWYIENWSLALDLKIIFITIIKTLTGDPNAY